MKKVFQQFAAGCALLTCSIVASAAPITGSIGFGFGVNPLDGPAGSAVAFDAAKYIDVIGDAAIVTTVEAGSTLGGIFGLFSPVAYYDFSIDPFSAVEPLWSGSGVSFDLLTMSIDQQTTLDLDLSGTGIMKLAGYDDTEYSWSFSADSTGAVFSASSTNAPVSEPAILALLGIGLAGLSVTRRKTKA